MCTDAQRSNCLARTWIVFQAGFRRIVIRIGMMIVLRRYSLTLSLLSSRSRKKEQMEQKRNKKYEVEV